MTTREAIAQSEGRTLLTLDTVYRRQRRALYRSLGYVSVGVIPRFARGPLTPELEATTIMYKDFAPPTVLEPKVMESSPGRRTNRSITRGIRGVRRDGRGQLPGRVAT